MKVDRKTKVATDSKEVKTKQKSRRVSSKSVKKTNGKHPLATYGHIPVGIVEASLEGRYLDVNGEFCRILGYSRQELLQLGIKDCTHEDDYAIDSKLYEQLIAGKIPFYRLEKRYLRKEGGDVWVELTRTLICDEKGKPVYTVGVVLDISDRKDVERVLRESVERLRLATSAAQMFMWEWDFQNQSYVIADNFEKVLGFSANLLPKNKFETLWALCPKEDIEQISNAFERAVENQRDLHALPCRVINPEDEQIVWLEISAKIVYDDKGNPERMFGVAQNITESKKIQNEIAVISRMPAENPNPVMRIAREGKISYANPASAALMEDWMQGLQPVLPEDLQQIIAQTFTSSTKAETEFEYRGKHFSFTVVPVVESGYVNLYGKDITERKRAEQALTESARQQEALYKLSEHLHRTDSLQGVFDAALDAILNALQCDRASILLYDNQAVMRFVAWRGLSDEYRKAIDGHSPWKPDAKDPQSIHMDDVRTADLEESLRAVIQAEGIGALAFIPLVVNEELIGKFMIYYDAPHAFDEAELDLSRTIAHQLAFGIDRRRSEEALARERELLTRLFDTMPVMISMIDPATLSHRVNTEFERRTGWRSNEVTIVSLLEALYPDPEYRQSILQRMAAATDTNEWVEVQVRTREGKVMDSMWANISIMEGEKLITGIALGVDITERKKTEQALRESEERFRTMANTMPSIVWTAAPDGTITYANDQWFRYVGITSEANATHWPELVLHPDDYERCVRAWTHALETVPDEYLIEVRNRRYDGQYRWFQTRAVPVRDDSGKAKAWYGVTTDIHERIEAQNRLGLLAEISDMLRNVDDPNDLMYRISEAVGEHLHVKRALFNEIDLEHDREIVHRDYHKGWDSVAGIHKISEYSSITSADVAAGRTVVNNDSKADPRTAQDYERTYAVSGERAYVVVPLMRDNRWLASLWVSDDTPRQWSSEEVSLLETVAERTWAIVEKLRLAEELRAKEAELEAIISQTPFMLTRCTRDLRYRFVSRAYADMIGRKPEEIAGQPIVEVMGEEGLKTILPYVEQVLQGNRVEYETAVWFEGIGVPYLHVVYTPDWDEQGNVIGWFASIVDITERKRMEEALSASEQRFREIFETAGVSVWVEDFSEVKSAIEELRAQGVQDLRAYFNEHPDFVQRAIRMVRIIDVNNETVELFRAKDKAELLQSLDEIFLPATQETFIEELIALAEGREMVRAETVEQTLDGHPISVIFTVHFGSATGDLRRVVVTLTDITARKQVEEALRIENERFMRFVDSNIVGILIGDASGNVILANDYYLRLLGVSRQQFDEGRVDWKQFTPPEWLHADEKAIQELRARGVCEPYEKEYIRADGTRVPVYIADAMLPGPGDEIAAFVLDITERKQAENALRIRARQQQAVARLGELALRERDLQEVFDRATAAVAETLEVEYCKVLELLGSGESLLLRAGVGWREGLVGRATVDTGLDSQAGFTLQSAEPVVVEDLRREPRFHGPPLLWDHGVVSGMSCIIRGVGGLPWGVLGTHSTRHVSFTEDDVNFLVSVANILGDAIQREQAEEALRASEERYRFIVENTSDGIWQVELTEPMPVSLPEEAQIMWYYRYAVMRQCNLGLARMYGYHSIEDVVDMPMRILMPPEIPANLELSRQFIRSQYRLVDAESREVGPDGRELIFLNNMVGIVEDGKLIGEWGTNRDITERKRAEEALRRNEQMLSTMIEAAPFGVYFIDSEFRLRAINKGSDAVFSGIDPLIGRDFAEILRIIWKEPFATEAIERFRHTLRTGESFVSPTIIGERANIDEIQAYDWQIHRITLGDGTLGVVCYFYDLSEQKQLEATVRASESLYRAIARNIPGGGVYVVDKDFRYLVAEGPVTESFRLTREMLEGHTVMEVFPDERGQGMVDRLKRTFAGESLDFETQFNGRVYWTQQAPLHGSIGQAIILTLDITERKQAEEALRQSEERFARFMQHLPGLAWIKDLEGHYVYANAAAEKAFNTPREKLLGQTDEDIFPAEVAAQFRANDEQALTDEKGVQVIETLKHADGVLHYSLVSKFAIPRPDGSTTLIGGTAFDITERLQAEEALRESEERFRALLRQATAGIVRKDAGGCLVFVNEAFCSMLGRTESELLGKTIWDFMHPDDVAESKQSYERLMLEGIPFKLERRLLREDGSVIWVDASVSPILDATGRPQSAVAVEVDITGRKRAEEALQQLNLQLEDRVLDRTARLRAVNQTLREEIAERQRVEEALRQSEALARANEEKLSTLFNLLPVGISFLDPQGQIIQTNPALANILKLSGEQWSDESYRSRKYIRANGILMPPEEFASRRALTEGKTVYNVETGVVLENGEVVWTSVSAAPVAVADVGAVVVTADITESKRAEQSLQESRERLQFLSQRLVEVQEEERRAIARELHDRVGQTLAALNINLIIISGQLGRKVDEQVSSRLSDSMKLVSETISLVRDVMSDLRPSVLDDYGLEAAIESHLSQYVSRYEIEAKFEKPDHPIPRLVPSMEMTFLRIAQEALMNIARHAHASQIRVSLWQEKNIVCMVVQDNGLGIASWQEANRPGSHGLTIMRERAEAFGGSLKVSSVPGQGTKVEVKIPMESNNPSKPQKEVSE